MDLSEICRELYQNNFEKQYIWLAFIIRKLWYYLLSCLDEGCTKAGVSRHQPPTTGVWFQSQACPRGVCGGHGGTGAGFSSSTSLILLSVSFHCCSILFLNTAVIRRTRGRSPGTVKQSSAYLNIGEHWVEKYIDVLFR